MKRLLAFLAVLAASPAWAGGPEASISGGYTTAGGIEHQAVGITDLKVKGSFSWGTALDYWFSPHLGVQGSWSWQPTTIEISTPAGTADMVDIDVHRLQAGVLWQLGGEKSAVRPFLSAGLGAAFLTSAELDTETKLALSLGGGVTWRPKGRLGVRLQARWAPIHLADAGGDFCDPFGFCQDWLQQGEVTGGVVLRF